MRIPKHTKCSNCGRCCGPVPISQSEEIKIRKFVKKMDIFTKQRLTNQLKGKDFLTCQFRDTEQNKCAIYPVRPLLCKLFGISIGLECCNGNSAYINGYKYLNNEPRYIMPKMI